jgi:transcriptional regulator GlxA family with amidase domain
MANRWPCRSPSSSWSAASALAWITSACRWPVATDLHNKKLVRVIGEMERQCEQPLPNEALADQAGISVRQLERLFRHHLATTPSAFYLGLRLDKARQLLRQSDLSVLEVSLACGFDSASYFSRCYRRRFATSPQPGSPRTTCALGTASATCRLKTTRFAGRLCR